MDHPVLPAITPMPASTSYAFTRWRLPRLRLRISNCSLLLIYLPPKGWKAESAWLADLQRMVYPHKWSPISCRSSAGQGKFTGQRPTFYQLCHATSMRLSRLFTVRVVQQFSLNRLRFKVPRYAADLQLYDRAICRQRRCHLRTKSNIAEGVLILNI